MHYSVRFEVVFTGYSRTIRGAKDPLIVFVHDLAFNTKTSTFFWVFLVYRIFSYFSI